MVTLATFAASDTDYVQKLNNNFSTIEAELNSLAAQILASVGAGADLILDTYDRDGVVGAHSYVLDLDAYAGGSQIKIGRRPGPIGAFGEIDQSVAWGTFGGVEDRVFLNGDVTLDANPIVSGLPKTIYVAIASDGTPQLFETDTVLNVIYIWSMTWDGFSLTNFKRIGHILPHYTTLQAIAGAPKVRDIFDTETDWLSSSISDSAITLLGASDDNGIDVDGSVEILGFFITAEKQGADGWLGTGFTPEDNLVRIQVKSNGDDYAESPFEFDASNVPDTIFKKVSGTVEKFITEVQRFTLELTGIGPFVVSARAFSWGIIYRPIIGLGVPKNPSKVGLI